MSRLEKQLFSGFLKNKRYYFNDGLRKGYTYLAGFDVNGNPYFKYRVCYTVSDLILVNNFFIFYPSVDEWCSTKSKHPHGHGKSPTLFPIIYLKSEGHSWYNTYRSLHLLYMKMENDLNQIKNSVVYFILSSCFPEEIKRHILCFL
jgi:hypothetical protein